MDVGWFGSVVLLLIGKAGVVIATDSLVNRIGGGSSRTECKIAWVREKVVFAATGIGRFEQPSFDPYNLAVEVGARQSLPLAAKDYHAKSASILQLIWNNIRTTYLQFENRNDDPLLQPVSPHSYVFAGIDEDGLSTAAGGTFTEKPGRRGLLDFDKFEVKPRTDEDVHILRSGSHDAMPNDAEVSKLIGQVGGPEVLKQLIEMQIRNTPRLVGPPVSVLVIPVLGKATWHSVGLCSER
jgi:hypothetical protein